MNKTKAIVKREGLSLMGWQMKKLYTPTPKEEIYKREGAKKRIFDYVKIGYVIKKLNEIFSPIGWDFEIIEQGTVPKSVWVKGRLTIKDHKGHTVTKTQYGQHKDYPEVPIGDAYKAASSDCLKKCASMLGIALDVYSRNLDQGGEKDVLEEKENKVDKLMASDFEKKRIEKIAKDIGYKVSIKSLDKLTKIEASKILFKLLEKRAKR